MEVSGSKGVPDDHDQVVGGVEHGSDASTTDHGTVDEDGLLDLIHEALGGRSREASTESVRTVSRVVRRELGVPLSELEIDGDMRVWQSGVGNVTVGGGWSTFIASVINDDGARCGYVARLDGLSAFLDAFLDAFRDRFNPDDFDDAIADSNEDIVFHDPDRPMLVLELETSRALNRRLLAALAIVSRVAIDAAPAVEPGLDMQRRAYAVWLRDDPRATSRIPRWLRESTRWRGDE